MHPIDRHVAAPPREDLDPQWLAQALGAAWVEQRLRVRRQIALIERAIAALDAHGLEERDRRQAARVAHKLAGAVAMFGFVRAAEIARRLELELLGAEDDRAPGLLTLTLRARAEIDRPLRLGRPDANAG
jgi:chemotaxis protein histidine kinase CheA